MKTISLYSVDGELTEVQEYGPNIDAARDFVKEVLRHPEVELPPAVVIDVGMIEQRGWAIVEANPCWGSGIYACDEDAVLDTLERACLRPSELSKAEEKWLISREVTL